MNRVILFPLLSCVLCLAGCIRNTPNAYDGISSVNSGLTPAMADDAALRLSMAFAPGHTSLRLEAGTPFGQALENALRRRGFTISPSGDLLGYRVDVLRSDASLAYAHLFLNGGSLSQMYSLANGMAVPSGNLVKSGLPDFSPDVTPLLPTAPPVPPAPVIETAEAAPAPAPDRAAVQTPAPVKASGNNDAFGPTKRSKHEIMEAASAAEFASAAGEPAQASPLAPPVPDFSVTTMAAPASEPVEAGNTWIIAPGLLKSQLEGWAELAGYQIIWKAQHDYEMQSRAIFRDGFAGAVKRLIMRMHVQGNPLKATIYQDNKVLEITED